MKIGTCKYQQTDYVFVEYKDEIYLPALNPEFDDPAYRSMLEFIQQEKSFDADFLAQNCKVSSDEITLLAPIPRPTKNIMCLGLNYTEHVNETAGHMGRKGKKPAAPIVFTKSVTSVIGAEAIIPYDANISTQLDWEAELGVVIGKGGKAISQENALEHVFGYTIINEISEPQNLNLGCRVNGDTKQDSNTSMMIFDIAMIIETLSKSMTLEPGDIIATGTPSGVGFVREPAEFLMPGDTVECEIEGIGVLRNYIRSAE